MSGITTDPIRNRLRLSWTALQPWRVVVLVVAAVGMCTTAVATIELTLTGIVRPWVVAGGLLATVLINRVYVVVTRRGEVLEGIDLAEAPIVALALVLPPAEALLTFVVASAIVEFPRDRALVKKLFNVGIRATGGGLLVAPFVFVGTPSRPGISQFVAAAAGAALYTAINVLAVSTIIASVEQRPIGPVLLGGTASRLLVWSAAVATGLSSGYAIVNAPGALIGVIALLVVVSVTTAVSRRTQRENDRLRNVLDTSARIQSCEDTDEQEASLLDVAQQLLLWRDVSIGDTEPGSCEQGAPIYTRNGRQRWLIASPRPDSDPWTAEDARILDALASAARAAFDRTQLQAQLTRQALFDPLTGVANRRGFDDAVARLAAENVTAFGVILCDLDGFKNVNDAFGHDVGDELLRITAARLTASIRSTDHVARLGGDEFAVVLPSVESQAEIACIAAKIRARLDQPVQIGAQHLPRIATSLGFATGSTHGVNPREVLRAADAAMYDVKNQHKSDRSTLALTLPLPR
jgi:diguanylate cyclase (GGDEF)-like protein